MRRCSVPVPSIPYSLSRTINVRVSGTPPPIGVAHYCLSAKRLLIVWFFLMPVSLFFSDHSKILPEHERLKLVEKARASEGHGHH